MMTNFESVKMENVKGDQAKKEEDKRKQGEDLTNLWNACYFEKRITRPLLMQINLLALIRKLQAKVEANRHDFRSLSPLIAGLAKLYQKKMQALLNDSSQTLESLKNPFAKQEEKFRKKYNRAEGAPQRRSLLTGAKLVDNNLLLDPRNMMAQILREASEEQMEMEVPAHIKMEIDLPRAQIEDRVQNTEVMQAHHNAHFDFAEIQSIGIGESMNLGVARADERLMDLTTRLFNKELLEKADLSLLQLNQEVDQQF